ncbi:vWA domain-containing protein [Haloglomus halophilum]|uniref:vWA domain-containing protein n=1 Tax=Haloglomus halophilum TaxID=2962672 RepID=UPI0020C974EE|nr:vWA domain-containing protein [Haloglomus halophilum]
MTTTNTETTQLYPLSRRDVMRTAAILGGAAAVGGVGTTLFPTVRAAEPTVIQTCGGDVDIVVALDYSGSIYNTGSWPDIESGVDSFLGVVPDDVQLGLVTFGDAPDAFEYSANNLLDFATATNVAAFKAGIPPAMTSNENATHMPGALAFSNAILANEGRAGKEIILLITDGSPNYQNGVVGDGAAPPADDTSFPYGTFPFTGGTASEDGTIQQTEKDETATLATTIKNGGRRIITVGVGTSVDDDYLMNSIASTPDDYVAVEDPANLGTELETLISEVCEPECAPCALDESVRYEYVVEYDDEGTVTFDGFVLDGDYDGGISYVSDVDKDGSMYDPMSATFDLGGLCDAWAVVKAGQEFAVTQVTADDDGSVTVGYVDPYAISFVAFFCTEADAQAFAESFPSRGRGGGRPSDDSATSTVTGDSGGRGQGHAHGRGKATGKGNGLARGR